ncbi:hypothetical protein GS491_19075 [Rhodococcus hoagii]|nr:hypothetical protein [Prescottella equi]NKT01826.1 hypothetical protein [Prescottella equi]
MSAAMAAVIVPVIVTSGSDEPAPLWLIVGAVIVIACAVIAIGFVLYDMWRN